jgi:hypothetical protein
MQNKKAIFYRVSILILSLISVLISGIITINTQKLTNLKTYSGGFPISWFEYYYPPNTNLNLKYIINNWHSYYKIDLLGFALNTIAIYCVITFILFIAKSGISKIKNLKNK